MILGPKDDLTAEPVLHRGRTGTAFLTCDVAVNRAHDLLQHLRTDA